MPVYKLTLTIEKIVECDSWSRANGLAISDISDADIYDQTNWNQYELSADDLNANHNKNINIVK